MILLKHTVWTPIPVSLPASPRAISSFNLLTLKQIFFRIPPFPSSTASVSPSSSRPLYALDNVSTQSPHQPVEN